MRMLLMRTVAFAGTAAEAVWLLSQLKAFLHPSAVASSLQHTALTGTLHADDEVYPTEVNGHVGERSKIAYNKVLHFTRRFVYVLGWWPAANLRVAYGQKSGKIFLENLRK